MTSIPIALIHNRFTEPKMLEKFLNFLKDLDWKTAIGFVNMGVAFTFIKLIMRYQKKQTEFQKQQLDLQNQHIILLNSLRQSEIVKEIQASRIFYEEKKTILEAQLASVKKESKQKISEAEKELVEAQKKASDAQKNLAKVLSKLKLTESENERLNNALNQALNANRDHNVKLIGKMLHEFKVPLIAIRGATEAMGQVKEAKNLFDYDYIGDIWMWSELLRRLIGNAEILQRTSTEIQPKISRVLLAKDVIVPVLKQVELLLHERNFSSSNIRYSLSDIPVLFFDRDQLQQVFFNLLSNSIKFCNDDPKRFRVDIHCHKHGKEFSIIFRDWGIGIPADMEESIFELGFRTPEAIQFYVTGQGLGLWVVRRIVEAHGAKIKLTNRENPTEFTIYLPEALTSEDK